jgi:hypothetical protein
MSHTEGVNDTAYIDGKTRYEKLRMNKHTDTELCLRGLEEFLLVRWTDKIKALKKHEQQRAPTGDNKYFFAQSGALFIISKL